MHEEFEKWTSRVAQRPLLEVDNERGVARYAHEELTTLGCSYVKRRKFADNPKSPLDYRYYAPNEQVLFQANDIVFQKSRATAEQIGRIRAALDAGQLTFDQLKMTPHDLEGRLAEGKLSQTDAKGILYHVEPANERTIESLRGLASSGQLTDAVMRNLVQDGHKLTDDQARLGVEGLLKALETPETLTFTLRNCYDIDSAAKKMADITLQRKVRAFEALGALRGAGEIDYDRLTASNARQLVRSGEAYASGGLVNAKMEELNREGWSAAGTSSRYSDHNGGQQRNYADGTYQGAKARSDTRVRELLADETIQPWPERGLLAGIVRYADGFNVVVVSHDGTRVADLEQFARFEAGYTPAEHEDEFVGFVMNRRGAFGIGFPSATSQGEAIVLLDAQQFKRDEGKEIKAIGVPRSPVSGTVIAMRGDFVALDLESGETVGVRKPLLDNPQPKYGEMVTFTPEGQAVTIDAPDVAPARRARVAR